MGMEGGWGFGRFGEGTERPRHRQKENQENRRKSKTHVEGSAGYEQKR